VLHLESYLETVLMIHLAKFEIDWDWKAAYDAEIVGSIGHLHDGGTKTQIFVDGKMACENVASYGTKPEFVQPEMSGMSAHSHGAPTKHISDMSTCFGNSLSHSQMKKGQKWTLKAHYDFDQNKGMQHDDGAWDEVMGIEFIFVRKRNA
jgi:hypothetical protein